MKTINRYIILIAILFLVSDSNAAPLTKTHLDSLMDRGVNEYLQGTVEKAIPVFDSVVVLARKENNSKVLANAYNNLGNCYSQKGESDKALSFYQQSLKIAEESGDKLRMAKTQKNIGALYQEQGDLENAMKNAKQALLIAQEVKDSGVIADCYNNIGIIFEEKKQYPEALDVYSKALEIYKAQNDEARMAMSYNNVGIVYKYLKDYPKSIEYYLQSINYSQKSGDQFMMAVNQNNVGNVYVMMGQYDKALELYKQSLALSKEIKAANIIYEVYDGMADAYYKKGDLKQAYAYRLKFEEEKNNYISEERTRQLSEMQTKYETEKKEARIKDLQQTEQIQKEKIGRRNLFIIVILIVLIGSILIAYFYSSRQKLKAQIDKENAIRQSEENERIRIAKDIHDEIGSGLSRIHYIAQSIDKSAADQKINRDVQLITENTRSLIENMRDLIWALTPVHLTLDGLLGRIREYGSEFLEDFNIQFEAKFPEEDTDIILQKETYRNIFLLVKEALNNLAKHSRAKCASIEISHTSDWLKVIIRDDGKGFDTSINSSGNGLKNMSARAASIAAKLTIESQPSNGTTITLITTI